MQFAVLDDRRANGNRGIHVAIPGKVTHGPAVNATLDRLQLVDDLHRADLRRARQGAGRQNRAQCIHRRQAFTQLPGDVGHDVHHIGVSLDHHLLGQPHAPRRRHPADVVAAQVDQHQVLGDFFLVRQQVIFQSPVGFFVRTARACSGNRSHRDQVVFDPHQHLGRTADHMEVTEVEEVHVRRRVEAA
ncbi:hypothetical protein D3C76_1307690 [compost metagenome]